MWSMDYATYLQRMKGNYQFRSFGLEPKWVPGTGDIDGFIHDEVVRQFHDPRIEHDGGVRVRWMKAGWSYAQGQAHDGRFPDMDDIIRLGKYVEPQANASLGFRVVNVYIGDNTGAPPGFINEMVTYLVQRVKDVEPREGREGPHANEYRNLWRWGVMNEKTILSQFRKLTTEIITADDWYLCYEAIHPFGDGNGRSGKILHNWLLNTLDEPVLVEDYFGGGNP